jgi:hypothetical protein
VQFVRPIPTSVMLAQWVAIGTLTRIVIVRMDFLKIKGKLSVAHTIVNLAIMMEHALNVLIIVIELVTVKLVYWGILTRYPNTILYVALILAKLAI